MKINAALSLKCIRNNGIIEDYGVVSTRVITDAFVEALIDALQSPVAAFSDYRYHDSGEGTTAESETDTALELPCGEARDIGSQIEGASANIYRSVAIHTYAGTFSITEHGLLNAPSGGVLMDRSVFTAIDVTAGEQIQFNYRFTCISGG